MLNWDMVSLTSSEYRRRNLETLATHWESKGGKLADLAELIGMSPSYFSQLRSGARGVGDKTARKIEVKLEWPRGALDHVIGPPGSAGQALPIKHWPTLEEQEHALKNVVLFPDADILGTESDAPRQAPPQSQSRPHTDFLSWASSSPSHARLSKTLDHMGGSLPPEAAAAIEALIRAYATPPTETPIADAFARRAPRDPPPPRK